ncbi:hypothetical protein GDO86_016501 [Hymenochirus boettgeri]|uniref:Uncharacterized protein n=1 Tax=Hymenochirus boettgeri TaxID=247094 RepID=A0A8T2K2M4_9PIPI|nr:hypothetical protein GDO86_016501 [Hymenochirus boettgeri]
MYTIFAMGLSFLCQILWLLLINYKNNATRETFNASYGLETRQKVTAEQQGQMSATEIVNSSFPESPGSKSVLWFGIIQDRWS